MHAVRSEDLWYANDVAFWFHGASTFLSEEFVQVTVRDDDLDHGFVVSETKISVVEGQQTATFEIALKSESFVVTEEGEEISVGITIILTTLKGELLLSASALHFDWSGPQTVEVTANNDFEDEEVEFDVIYAKFVSEDEAYNIGAKALVDVAVYDDDVASVFIASNFLFVRRNAEPSGFEVVLKFCFPNVTRCNLD